MALLARPMGVIAAAVMASFVAFVAVVAPETQPGTTIIAVGYGIAALTILLAPRRWAFGTAVAMAVATAYLLLLSRGNAFDYLILALAIALAIGAAVGLRERRAQTTGR
jgi:hypothetical protein